MNDLASRSNVSSHWEHSARVIDGLDEAAQLRVLWVEDAYLFASALIRSMSRFAPGWVFDVVGCPEQGVATILDGRHDLALVDREFPGAKRGGLELCRAVRAAGAKLPIVMLSGWAGAMERVEALNAGADDFVAKGESSVLDLCTRMRVAVERGQGRAASGERSAVASILVVGDVTVHVLAQTVRCGGAQVELSGHPWRLLLRLALAEGDTVAFAELCSFAGIQDDEKHSNLHTEMSRLRCRLGALSGMVKSARGRGYYAAHRRASGGPDSHQK